MDKFILKTILDVEIQTNEIMKKVLDGKISPKESTKMFRDLAEITTQIIEIYYEN
jgi:hypothetical protein